jgi:hypothetical protein
MHDALKNFSAQEKGQTLKKEKNDSYGKKVPTCNIYEIKWNILVNIYYINRNQGSFSENLHKIYRTFYIKGQHRHITTYCEITNLQQ